jgi:AraC family transcriptional regulator
MRDLPSAPASYRPPSYPGKLWLDAIDGPWREVAVRGYSLGPMGVSTSTPRHVLVMYKSGSARMRRSIRGTSVGELVAPGDISVKSVQNRGGWTWDSPLDVLHLYIDPAWLDRVATEIHGPGLIRVALNDSVSTRDDELAWLCAALEREATGNAVGSHLMIPLLQKQLATTLIRRFATLERPPAARARLDARQIQGVHDHIAEHLGADLTVAALARSVGLSEDRFGRLFSATFDCSVHRYVMKRRVEMARELLQATRSSLVHIASEAGFADQSHLTRRFSREYGLSPSQWRSRYFPDPGKSHHR